MDNGFILGYLIGSMNSNSPSHPAACECEVCLSNAEFISSLNYYLPFILSGLVVALVSVMGMRLLFGLLKSM